MSLRNALVCRDLAISPDVQIENEKFIEFKSCQMVPAFL